MEELALAKAEASRAEEMRQRLDNNLLIDPNTMMHAIRRLEQKIHSAVGMVMDSGETQYVKAMIDPFNAECKGVRVP